MRKDLIFEYVKRRESKARPFLSFFYLTQKEWPINSFISFKLCIMQIGRVISFPTYPTYWIFPRYPRSNFALGKLRMVFTSREVFVHICVSLLSSSRPVIITFAPPLLSSLHPIIIIFASHYYHFCGCIGVWSTYITRI